MVGDLASGRLETKLQLAGGASTLDLSPDLRTLYAASELRTVYAGSEGVILRYDLTTGREIRDP
jgi:hypothetical protein